MSNTGFITQNRGARHGTFLTQLELTFNQETKTDVQFLSGEVYFVIDMNIIDERSNSIFFFFK